jgi:beta-lactamase class A
MADNESTGMPDFPELDPNADHTPDSLEATLQSYAGAIRKEFELAQSSTSAEDNAEQFSEDFAKKNLANNLAQLQWLAQNSTSDSVRANCSKYLVELARQTAVEDGDPIKVLMKKLIKNDKPTQSSQQHTNGPRTPRTPTEAMVDAMHDEED